VQRILLTFLSSVFSALSLYLIFSSLWLTAASFKNLNADLARKSYKTTFEAFKGMFETPIGPLTAAIVSTFGIYLIGSILYLDPWHMATSFFQYFILAPCFTNILNVYAFCNLHDVSWGTKGSDTVDILPSVKSKAALGSDEVVVEENTNTQEDIDHFFKETVVRALAKVEVSETREKPTMEDDNKTFRTHLVTAWLLTNGLLALAIGNIGGFMNFNDPKITAEKIREFTIAGNDRRNAYFAFLLYATFLLSMIRFMGVSAPLSCVGCAVLTRSSAVPVLLGKALHLRFVPQELSCARSFRAPLHQFAVSTEFCNIYPISFRFSLIHKWSSKPKSLSP
jgi:chitin synthase